MSTEPVDDSDPDEWKPIEVRRREAQDGPNEHEAWLRGLTPIELQQTLARVRGQL